ncbi:CaiB/BaiF CoA transferase family protein [Denitratisoma oestradiolicum]|uniref:CoA transferase n=1 Tax=Denitratisoma oestradiolicum TaxID=311182 RepID=A0A6S6YKI4_9PROT|nr:CaiB/BaiF CoA-transferase family protein [Denitratisoma oestradiolicum]TWO79249.1 CoA transferase [Denitratisoma oestradiolicum]CAB1368254.1 CoA transferase [Denitratisoma oestradiolicum]
MAGALSNVRVLDLSRVLAGPWATQTLADLGADVIKVERPGCGDDTRAWGPPYLKGENGLPTTESAYFLSTNRNKRSVAIDISLPDGQDIIRQLAANADILVENFKVGGLAQYGLSYEDVKKINPRIIYCSITGFGQDGPYASRAGYDFLIQGMGGLMSVTGDPNGDPQKVGVALTDVLTGLYTTVAALAALAHRERSGEGQHIDVALLDVEVACLANQAMNYLVGGTPPQRLGNMHPNIVPYQSFPTSNGDMILAIGNDGQFRRFCEVAGRPEWAEDERFRNNTKRVQHRDELVALIREVTSRLTTKEWVAALEKVGVPCGPINDIADVFDDPQVRHRGLHVQMKHPTAGVTPSVASPLRMTATPVEYRRAPPLLGEHSSEVLQDWLKMDDDTVNRLLREGVVSAG